MTKIKFGTDGWRAIIAQEYTTENVQRVAEGTAKWLKSKGHNKVVIGHDCRFGGELFAKKVARVMGANDIKVHLAKGFVSTPMVSLGVVKTKSDLGIVITASHNPPSYNGYKLKSAYGGPTIPVEIAEVEALIPEKPVLTTLPELEDMLEKGLLNHIDLEMLYIDHAVNAFDLDTINQSSIKIAYDAMYGAGQNVVQRLLTNVVPLHCDENPSFRGQAPEPIHRNLAELSDLIKKEDSIACGLANDGDADRIGMYDANGDFVDSHHLILLLIHYLYKYKSMTGKVVITFSVSDKVKKMCEAYGLDYEVTKIGFKYIAEIMINENVLVGGEESGGLAVKGHIPERDGVWMGLLIFEFMAKTGKSLQELIKEVYEVVGAFAVDRDDLHIAQEQKERIVETCKNNPFRTFGDYQVEKVETIDGFKFHLGSEQWVMIRPSGTEPVLRVYAQAKDNKAARAILEATKATVLQ